MKSASQRTYEWWRIIAAALSAIGAVIHAYYIPEHLEEWVGYGAFFIAASACELLLALVLAFARYHLRPHVLWAGIAGNAAIVALWLVTRTIGVPLGPMAGMIEQSELLDVASTFAEAGVIVCLALLLRIRTDTGAPDASSAD